MKNYKCVLTVYVDAKDEDEALKMFWERVFDNDYPVKQPEITEEQNRVICEKNKYRKINGAGENCLGDQSVSSLSAGTGKTSVKVVKI